MHVTFRSLTILAAVVMAAACDDPKVTVPETPGPAAVTPPRSTDLASVAGEVLADTLAVRVTTKDGRPLRDVHVSWSVLAGGGSVIPEVSVTDSAGVARAAGGSDPGPASSRSRPGSTRCRR